MVQSLDIKTQSPYTRETQLQFLRFLAFLNIFILHTEDFLFFPYPVSHCGHAAVSFFFMLSGLVAGLSCWGRAESFSLGDHGRYMWNKICKIYPLHFLTMLLSIMLSEIPHLLAEQNMAGLKEPLIYLAKYLLLIQSWFPDDTLKYSGASWFLSTLLFLYALNLPLSAVLNRVRKLRRGMLLLFGASLAVASVIVVYCYFTQDMKMGFWHNRFPPSKIAEYLIGMIWGFLIREGKQRFQPKKYWRWLFTAAEIFALIYWVDCLSSPGNYWRNYIISWLRPNCLLLIVFACGYGWLSELFRKTPFVRLGDLSFGCYLIHGIVVKIYRESTGYDFPSMESKVFAFLFCLGVSVLLAHMLDRPKHAARTRSKSVTL